MAAKQAENNKNDSTLSPSCELEYLLQKKDKEVWIKTDDGSVKSSEPLLFGKNGLPTLETLKHNGKIKLITYPEADEVVTEKPRKPMNGYLIYIKTIREEVRRQNPNKSFQQLAEMMSRRWREQSHLEKAEYDLLAKEEMKIYE